MPSLKKRIDCLEKEIKKISAEKNKLKNLHTYPGLLTELNNIQSGLDVLENKISNPDNYNELEENSDSEDSISANFKFERLDEIKKIFEDRPNLKIEKMIELYIESVDLLKKCTEIISKKNLEIIELDT
jgi:hypothetical protein